MNHLSNLTGGATGGAANPGAGAGANAGANAGEHKDYGDKVFDAVAKKSGHNVNANTAEKITDGARGLFEKATGKKVSSKISN
ncbi:hypothetical protein B0J18DRAFT_429842 [Chaetomium sp. MPI-SDFR-AT-0129]|uniref:Uncharacterized protein n=1 Tax=Dichotomopilus funicola TaxID=1934379 RepID=A0AAN6V903_9PEZI|nr:hypothetical protein B0J18DRAFT_429842 [Chaetomium sp. MPI-SDFR-AT-0129]KAK4146980.1 hypothetical protein C8A04DRAFT_25175 [Dichotomopilus funicola]